MLKLKRFMPTTLFGRALVIIIAPLILVQLVAAYVFYDRVWETVTRRLANGLAGDIGFVLDAMARYPDAQSRQWLFRTAPVATEVIFTLREGASLPRTGPERGSGILERLLVNALNERVNRPYLLDVWSDPRDVRVSVQVPEGVIDVRARRERVFTDTVYIFLLWMAGSSLLFFAIASVFMKNQVRPIQRLAHAADEFGKGREAESFHPHGGAEVRQAGNAFVVMKERIQRHIQQRTEMLAGVSHDLRTPLTRMKLELAMLGDGPGIAGLKSDVADMERMVDSYLAFARGEGAEQAEPTDMSRLLAEIVATARRDGHAVELEAPERLEMWVRPNAIKRALNNLVANATRHGTRVEIRAQHHDHWAEILIDDNGPGIPTESREDVFKPFFRLDESRNAATGGVGLGLTIARDIARAHGGDIAFDDAPLGGCRARVRLPV